jgi:hypothetical protein
MALHYSHGTVTSRRRPARRPDGHARRDRSLLAQPRRIEMPDWTPMRPPSEAQIIDTQVRDLTPDQLLLRYHDLIDRRLDGSISVKESFELGRIEARLDVDERDDLDRAAAFRREWDKERETVLVSLERMLARIRTSI